MSVTDPQRIVIRVKSFDETTGKGIAVDKEGFEYPLSTDQLGPEFKSALPRPLEVLEAVELDPGRIGRVSDPKTERINFDSVGPNPDGGEIASLRGLALEGGRPDTGLGGGQPDTGRFSRQPDKG